MVEFLSDLSNNSVDWDDLIDWDQITIKTELIREALSGPTRDLRQSILTILRQEISPLASQAGKDYQEARAYILKAQQEEKLAKSKKEPSTTPRKRKPKIGA